MIPSRFDSIMCFVCLLFLPKFVGPVESGCVCLKGKHYWRYNFFSLNHDYGRVMGAIYLPPFTSCFNLGFHEAYRLYLFGLGSRSLVTEVSKGTTEAMLETEAWWHSLRCVGLGGFQFIQEKQLYKPFTVMLLGFHRGSYCIYCNFSDITI